MIYNYSKDMESVEESWKNELLELTSYARRLQEEKENLLCLIRDQDINNQDTEQRWYSFYLLLACRMHQI